MEPSNSNYKIEITSLKKYGENWQGQVKINDKYDHVITIDPPYHKSNQSRSLNENHAKDILLWSIDFLLKREPPAAILPEFNLSKINDYFPEFDKEIKNIYDR